MNERECKYICVYIHNVAVKCPCDLLEVTLHISQCGMTKFISCSTVVPVSVSLQNDYLIMKNSYVRDEVVFKLS